jgi:hypothetical protein
MHRPAQQFSPVAQVLTQSMPSAPQISQRSGWQ